MSITDKIGDQLGKKLGPLPVWGWGVIGAAGIWIFRSMGIGKPSPARTSSGIGRVSLGSGSGGAMPGSYPPPISPAFGAPSYGAPYPGPYDWYEQPKDFTLVGPNEEPTEVSQRTVNPASGWALYWLNSPGSYVGVYASRLAASQAAQSKDPNSSPPGSNMGIARLA